LIGSGFYAAVQQVAQGEKRSEADPKIEDEWSSEVVPLLSREAREVSMTFILGF